MGDHVEISGKKDENVPCHNDRADSNNSSYVWRTVKRKKNKKIPIQNDQGKIRSAFNKISGKEEGNFPIKKELDYEDFEEDISGKKYENFPFRSEIDHENSEDYTAIPGKKDENFPMQNVHKAALGDILGGKEDNNFPVQYGQNEISDNHNDYSDRKKIRGKIERSQVKMKITHLKILAKSKSIKMTKRIMRFRKISVQNDHNEISNDHNDKEEISGKKEINSSSKCKEYSANEPLREKEKKE